MADLPAFATAASLAERLGVPTWPDGSADLAQVDALLADASDHLRDAIGWQVWPAVTVTLRVPAGCGRHLALPGRPVTEVLSVTSRGVEVLAGSYELVDGALERAAGWPAGALVTYVVGYAEPPAPLASWARVLAAPALSAVKTLGELGGGATRSTTSTQGPFTEGRTYQVGSEATAFDLPPRVQDQLRATYGSGGVFVTGAGVHT